MHPTDYIVYIVVAVGLLAIFVIGFWGYLGKDLSDIWKQPASTKKKASDTIILLIIVVLITILFNFIF